MTKTVVAKNWHGLLHPWPGGKYGSRPPPDGPDMDDGEFLNVTPPGPTIDTGDCLGQGLYVDPSTGRTWWCNGPIDDDTYGGLWLRSGWNGSWARGGNLSGGGHVENPVHVSVNPSSLDDVLVACGVRGTLGLFRSTDGGVTVTRITSLDTALSALGITGTAAVDLYQVVREPSDPLHVLATFHTAHSAGDSGIARSTDGGLTWSYIAPPSGIGTGNNVHFITSTRWLFGGQDGGGLWLTDNSGGSWTKVHDNSQTHGGSQICIVGGAIYVPTHGDVLKSTNSGESFTTLAGMSGEPAYSVATDGTRLYSRGAFDTRPIKSALIASDATWGNVGTQNFATAPFFQQYIAHLRLLVISFWGSGLWFYKVPV